MSLLLTMVVAAVVVAAALLLSGKVGRMDPSLGDPENLAALLVSEIKLYNADLIEKGLREKAIYAHLRDDIESSRKLYEERIGDPAAAGSHFDDALVRILADGDPSALGERD